jgi:tight adherence protein B
MADQGIFIFVGLVFAAVFFLANGLAVPVFGENRAARKRLKERLDEIDRSSGAAESMSSILREKYLRDLSPIEQAIESIPSMESLSRTIEQAGHKILAYRLVLAAVVIAVLAAYGIWEWFRIWWLVPIAAAMGGWLPFMWISRERAKRFEKFEEQLPDCIDVIRRALMAGHPFTASLKLVSEDMEEPAAGEFGLVFADINYGNDVRHAMMGLLGRVPGVSVMAFVTAILVQKESGGNLAEILGEISSVIRGRFRFQRKVKTLSAEGRMSAWVLAMVPLGLFLMLTISNPGYLPIMLEDEFGQNMVAFAAVWSIVGIYFIRRIIRIEV